MAVVAVVPAPPRRPLVLAALRARLVVAGQANVVAAAGLVAGACLPVAGPRRPYADLVRRLQAVLMTLAPAQSLRLCWMKKILALLSL